MLMKRAVFAALVLIVGCLPTAAQSTPEDIVVFTLSTDEMEMVENSTEQLKELAHEQDAECRQYPNQAQTLAGCAARNVYLDILESRDVCNTGPFLQDDNWVSCKESKG